MTLSILAVDAAQGLVGGAVTSCVLAVGPRIVFVRPDVGAAAVQASSQITWGEEILDALERGEEPNEAIAPFARRSDVQVAAINFAGRHAAYTGDGCAAHAGDAQAERVTTQVNLAVLPDAPERMVGAFLEATGQPLAERLVAALAASGGDIRGKQSAALSVTGSGPLTGYADEPHVDLRVDDHREPVEELHRLLRLHRAHCAMRLAWDNPTIDAEHVLAPLVTEHPDDPHLQRALASVRSRRRG